MQQPKATGKDIIETILKTMKVNLEPLAYTVLVPSIYRVYLHPDDHVRLQPIFPKINGQAKQRLNEELERLNRGSLWRRFLRWLLPIRSATYESAEDNWYISFLEGADDVVQPGVIEVYPDLAAPPKMRMSGSRTVRVMLRNEKGKIKKFVTTTDEDQLWNQDVEARSAAAYKSSSPIFARLSYRDDSGDHVYEMSKKAIVVGRGGPSYWVDLRLDGPEQISQEHFRLRRDEATGKFYIKDVSRLGTKVEGRKIPSSVRVVDGKRQDLGEETELPPRARINLGGVINITFVASERK
ncbi:MAG TPA: FHA domain-containing protein [Blastocatellia bacterium]|nr:FHA domain-containing protein [Blastocatellia bacterium]